MIHISHSYYLYNAQGDVTNILNEDMYVVVTYEYDSWGKLLVCKGILADELGVINPFRYRGYVYDEETGFYYLNSRYYDPETGRFINADGYVSTGQGVLGYNMFAYCLNNPVNMSDISGYRAKFLCGFTTESSDKKNRVIEEDSNIELYNHVTMSHVYTVIAEVGSDISGKISLSSTTTKQDKDLGIIYSYSDVGNDYDKIGVGLNANNFFGVDVSVDTNGNFLREVQITPLFHRGRSLGLEGIGFIVGVDYKGTSYDLEIYLGWGLIIVAVVCPMVQTNRGYSTVPVKHQ